VAEEKGKNRPNHLHENFRPQTSPNVRRDVPQNYAPDTIKPSGGRDHHGNYVPPTSDSSTPTPPPMPKKK
jgi:hypothetical protein